jgi:hypothetical protein
MENDAQNDSVERICRWIGWALVPTTLFSAVLIGWSIYTKLSGH